MFFRKLPDELYNIVKTFTASKDFHEIINNDEVLTKLYDLEVDKNFEKQCLNILLYQSIEMFGHSFKPLTSIAVMRMWLNSNPLIIGEGNIELKHIDEFFQLLEYPDSKESCDGFTESNYTDILDNLNEVIETELKIAFFPLSLFPSNNVKGGSESVFDSDWLMKVCTIACHVGNCKLEEALRLPLFEITSMFIQYARMQGTKNIERQPAQEILKQEGYRVCELVINKLIELGKIDSSEREYYVDLVSTPPEESETNTKNK